MWEVLDSGTGNRGVLRVGRALGLEVWNWKCRREFGVVDDVSDEFLESVR